MIKNSNWIITKSEAFAFFACQNSLSQSQTFFFNQKISLEAEKLFNFLHKVFSVVSNYEGFIFLNREGP